MQDEVTTLKGPPIPTMLPMKGVGVFVENGKLKAYIFSRFNDSDTTLRTPVSFKNAARVLWNMLRS